jgi:hypothetical protein
VFDLDDDGKITKEEIGKMLNTLVDVINSNNKRRHRHHPNRPQEQNKQINLQKRIDDAFNELNANDDDHITKDEFIEWYMKSGLISDVQADEINVPDSSRLQLIGKKSRKAMKQTPYNKSNNEQDDNHRISHLVRHMSRMIERKSSQPHDDDDNNQYNNNNPTTVSSLSYHHDSDTDDEQILNNPSVRVTASSDDTDSHFSKDNERWQHIFNSVLGQIRAQRLNEQQQQQQQNVPNHFNAWKREGEEKLKSEYLKQKTNGQQNRSYLSSKTDVLQSSTTISNEPPPSPDVVSIRL